MLCAFDHRSAFFPHLRAEVSEMHRELRRTVLWGLLWWHSAVLLGSLLSRLNYSWLSPQLWPHSDTVGF